jgi:hypothetical protein
MKQLARPTSTTYLTRSNLLHFSTKSGREEVVLASEGVDEGNEATSSYLDYGILISSFTEGMTPSTSEFFLYSLARLLTMDVIQTTQDEIEESAKYSPCQGPSIDLLNKLERGDDLMQNKEKTRKEKTDLMLEYMKGEDLELKVLYIPTAMYALRTDSKNSSGKQRQRARADGKKRRNQLVEHIKDMFVASCDDEDQPSLNVLAVTLDFDDGSIKQPSGSEETSKFPQDGKEALTTWQPHVVYLEGGNTFWLLHCMEKGKEGWMQLLKDACSCQGNQEVMEQRRPALYIGKSAGAIVAGKYVETATWKGWDDPTVVPGKESYENWKGDVGLNVAGVASFFPHMSDDWIDLIDRKKGTLPADSDLYSLQEWDACCIEGSQYEIYVS